MTKHTTTTNTMQDALTDLPSLGYAESFAKNLRAALRKSAKIYGTDLDQVPADLDTFERHWGRGRIRRVPPGFRNAEDFRSWRKNVRMVLARREGIARGATLLQDWGRLIVSVRTYQGIGKVLATNSDLTLGVLAREASRAGVATTAITDDWIEATAAHLDNGTRKSFVRGIAGFNRLVDRCAALPELGDLLPAEPLKLPAPRRPAPHSWRRRAENADAVQIWSDFDRIMQRKRYGVEGPEIEGAPANFSEASVRSYEGSLSWLLGQLAAQERLETGMDLAEIITHANLVAAINHWIQRRRARGLPTETSTLHSHVSRLVHLAIGHLDAPPQEAARLVALRRKPTVRTASVGRMSAARMRWIRAFDADPALQLRAHRLPETLMARSNATLNRLENGRKVRPGEVMLALRLGVAALQVGILFRVSPIRATNLRTLRLRGGDAEFDLAAFTADPRLKEVRLAIPGAQVKNGAEIDEVSDDDLAPVLRWYLATIRPRLISAHPFGKNHVDSNYLFPSTSHAPMERSVFTDTFRRACIEVGWEMTMHQARHVCAYWILSIDPNAWGEAAALLGDDERTVRAYYGWLDQKKASAAARQKLQESRARTRRHYPGSWA